MSRCGLVEVDDNKAIALYREEVTKVIGEPQSQAFLREMAGALDELPEKYLIADELIDSDGGCCAIGAVCKARGLDVSAVDCYAPDQVAALVGVSQVLVSEIEQHNDCGVPPDVRWQYMRNWVELKITKPREA